MTEVPAGSVRRVTVAALYGVPIGCLGGLIGLGGGEFRLPVLVAVLGYTARAAVPMNLLISMITLAASLAIRSGTLSLAPVVPFTGVVLGLMAGGMLGAAWSAGLLARLSDHRLERTIAGLLAAIGLLLITEAFLPKGIPTLIPTGDVWRVPSGALFGLVIGTVSTLLGVAGGELLIPTLVIAFGADIRTAGTASLMISLVTVAIGLWRYGRLGRLPRRAEMIATAVPMGLGSIIGAVAGGLMVGLLPPSVLKAVLGLVLIAAALKSWRRRHAL